MVATRTVAGAGLRVILAGWPEDNPNWEGYFPEFRGAGGELRREIHDHDYWDQRTISSAEGWWCVQNWGVNGPASAPALVEMWVGYRVRLFENEVQIYYGGFALIRAKKYMKNNPSPLFSSFSKGSDESYGVRAEARLHVQTQSPRDGVATAGSPASCHPNAAHSCPPPFLRPAGFPAWSLLSHFVVLYGSR